ncbi:MAG TPA: CHASE3 domain-containing protein [Bryobacteraceae bacterium]|jgi:signal transduction histidine kinase|nr:CHASE3 domain-containing protein [Bryobacteraceae bacterium]
MIEKENGPSAAIANAPPHRALQRPLVRNIESWLICIAAIALFVIGRDEIQQYREISRMHKRVELAVLALQAADNVKELLLRAETAQRGYLLTGSPAYIQPYWGVTHEMPAALGDFASAMRQLSIDPQLAVRIQSLANAKLEETSRTIALHDRRGSAAAIQLVETNRGKQLMEQFAGASSQIKQQCVRVFTQDSQNLERKARRGLLIAIAGLGSILAVLLFAAARLWGSFARIGKLVTELQSAGEQYQLLVGRLESVREEERAHLAREIHDALGQTLTVIKLDIAIASRKLAGVPEMAPATARLDQATGSLDKTIQALRRVASELRPPLLDTAGLSAALCAYTEQLAERTGLPIRFDEEGEIPALSPEQRIAAFRIAQESLTNVIRHAAATDARVHLLGKENGVQIVIEDNGVGFSIDGNAAKRSLGLLGMQERARLAGGELSFESRLGKGTKVVLFIPVLKPETIVFP